MSLFDFDSDPDFDLDDSTIDGLWRLLLEKKGRAVLSAIQLTTATVRKGGNHSVGEMQSTGSKTPQGLRKQDQARTRQARLRAAPGESKVRPIASHDRFGGSKVVLLPVEPYRVFVYWDLDKAALAAISRSCCRDGKPGPPVLRFNDVTGIPLEPFRTHSAFDFPVNLDSQSCYVPLWRAGRAYVVELGFRDPKQGFVLLARSNRAETPQPPPQADDAHLPNEMNKPATLGFPDNAQQTTLDSRLPGHAFAKKAEDFSKAFAGKTYQSKQTTDHGKRHSGPGPEPDLTSTCENAFVSGISSKPGRPEPQDEGTKAQ